MSQESVCPGELREYFPDVVRGPGYRVTADGLHIGAPGFPQGWVLTCTRYNCDGCPKQQELREKSAAWEELHKSDSAAIRKEEADLLDRYGRLVLIPNTDGDPSIKSA